LTWLNGGAPGLARLGGGAAWLTRLGGGAARWHGLFGVMLAAAVALRVLAAAGYPSVLWTGDSSVYVRSALTMAPPANHPGAYPLLLWLLRPLHGFTAVVAAQAVLGLVTGVMVYALVWRAARSRWPERPWLAQAAGCAAAAPALFDGDRLQLEHLLVSDGLFGFLVMAALTALLWRRPVTPGAAGLAGLLVGCAAVTRTAGLPLIAVVVAGIVVIGLSGRRGGAAVPWGRVAATAAVALGAYAAPVGAYMAWFHSHHGVFGLNRNGAVWLYGRTAAFADCARIRPAPDLVVLCPRRPPRDRRIASPVYAAMFSKESPFRRIGGIYGPRSNDLAGRFASAAIRAQPLDYLAVVVRDTLRAFAPGHPPYPTTWTEAKYHFPWRIEGALNTAAAVRQSRLAAAYGGDTGTTRVVPPYARWVRAYQDRVYLPGPALAVLLLTGMVGVASGVRGGGQAAAAVPWLMAVAMLVVPAATADYDHRYVLPAIPPACLATALSLLALPPRDTADGAGP
jgi:hypothetical protein